MSCIFLLTFASFPRYYVCKKPLGFSWQRLKPLFVEQQTDRLFVVYEIKIKSHRVFDVFLLSQRKIAYGAEIWEQIVYISYCDVKHN